MHCTRLHSLKYSNDKPPLICLNHYLHLLIDMLLEFWYTRICFSHITVYYYGRIIWCALISQVSNLPMACKNSGFALIHHMQMCAMCHCMWQPNNTLNDSFIMLGKQCIHEEICNWVQAYLNAEDEKNRNEAIHDSEIWWSELFHLLYFDASCFVVVNVMHNLFLGSAQHFWHSGILSEQYQLQNNSFYHYQYF